MKKKIYIILEKNKNEYMDYIQLNFNNIPINYENSNLIIVYEFEFYFSDHMEILKHEIQYTRRIQEKEINEGDNFDINNYEQKWIEIDIKKFEKYL
jgi:hypothetical protein